ncbi:MAG: glycosyltransferase, partial [Patescibacteria group bacterium]|nr:glycosyltransferase [Patescibacteria group bacterium]
WAADPNNKAKREISEIIREAFLLSLEPDAVLITSLFEGYNDNAVTSIGKFDSITPVAVVFYDLFPLHHLKEEQLSPLYKNYYFEKLKHLKRAKILLAISDFARTEALAHLGFGQDDVINIGAGLNNRFIDGTKYDAKKDVLAKFATERDFLLYVGGADERKNLLGLLEAYALLPETIRNHHVLVIAGEIPDANIKQLKQAARKAKLRNDEIAFLGYVSDAELVTLYKTCKVFVLPSFTEGFGLPVLEAMACGAPAICSNTGALPEVRALPEAMFDPHNVREMADVITKALTDEHYRKKLQHHGVEQAQKFSWDQVALKTIKALEKISQPAIPNDLRHNVKISRTGIFKKRVLKILVIKLDHRGDWILALPAISKLRARYPYAEIDALIGSWNVQAAQSLGIFRKIYALDFFSAKSAEPPKNIDHELKLLKTNLEHYDIAIDLRRQRETRFILCEIPAKLRVGYATGIVEIDRQLDICLPAELDVKYQTIALNHQPIAMQILKLIDSLPTEHNDFTSSFFKGQNTGHKIDGSIAIFPYAGSPIKEWPIHYFLALLAMLEDNPKVNRMAVFIFGDEDVQPFRSLSLSKLEIYHNLSYDVLTKTLAQYEICIANNSSGAHLAAWLGITVVGIYGGHETVNEWQPVFGNNLILNVPVPCSPCHIAEKRACINSLECLLEISPKLVYRVIVELINKKNGNNFIHNLQKKFLESILQNAGANPKDLLRLSQLLARNFPTRSTKCIFIDTSRILVDQDHNTGIQRVVRNVIIELLRDPPDGYRVELVYATPKGDGYRYAKSFSLQLLNLYGPPMHDRNPIDISPGDIFFLPDLELQTQIAQKKFYQYLQLMGVRVIFFLHDILPVSMPMFFPKGMRTLFEAWLQVVMESDQVIANSESTARDFMCWLREKNPDKLKKLPVTWVNLGADIKNTNFAKEITKDELFLCENLSKKVTFLMVGTIEPSKGHEQVLGAFEQLWRKGHDVNLVIVGKQGWMVENLIKKLLRHIEYKKRLFWLHSVSDEFLEKIYASSNCLIAASYGEGFGLPLIEAARHGIPIIARDIPVFREIAGNHAYYFATTDITALALNIEEWLNLYRQNKHPKCIGIKWLSWKESVAQLKAILTEQKFLDSGC